LTSSVPTVLPSRVAVIVAVQAALPYSGASFSVMELTDAPAAGVVGPVGVRRQL